jgi:hypothetical protein
MRRPAAAVGRGNVGSSCMGDSWQISGLQIRRREREASRLLAYKRPSTTMMSITYLAFFIHKEQNLQSLE